MQSINKRDESSVRQRVSKHHLIWTLLSKSFASIFAHTRARTFSVHFFARHSFCSYFSAKSKVIPARRVWWSRVQSKWRAPENIEPICMAKNTKGKYIRFEVVSFAMLLSFQLLCYRRMDLYGCMNWHPFTATNVRDTDSHINGWYARVRCLLNALDVSFHNHFGLNHGMLRNAFAPHFIPKAKCNGIVYNIWIACLVVVCNIFQHLSFLSQLQLSHSLRFLYHPHFHSVCLSLFGFSFV